MLFHDCASVGNVQVFYAWFTLVFYIYFFVVVYISMAKEGFPNTHFLQNQITLFF